MRSGIGWLLGLVVRLWVATLRVRVVGRLPEGGAVWAFWHGQQMALLAARPQRLAALVSWSPDGLLQVGVMRALGIVAVRGSSSRGGAAGLRGMVRWLAGGGAAAFACDGPRGPVRSAKPGAAEAARLSGAPLVPVGCSASRGRELDAWDRFELPLPFSRVVIVVGGPLEAGPVAESPELLTRAIEACRRRAKEACAAPVSVRNSPANTVMR